MRSWSDNEGLRASLQDKTHFGAKRRFFGRTAHGEIATDLKPSPNDSAGNFGSGLVPTACYKSQKNPSGPWEAVSVIKAQNGKKWRKILGPSKWPENTLGTNCLWCLKRFWDDPTFFKFFSKILFLTTITKMSKKVGNIFFEKIIWLTFLFLVEFFLLWRTKNKNKFSPNKNFSPKNKKLPKLFFRKKCFRIFFWHFWYFCQK